MYPLFSTCEEPVERMLFSVLVRENVQTFAIRVITSTLKWRLRQGARLDPESRKRPADVNGLVFDF